MPDLMERFFAKVDVPPAWSACWLWTATKTHNGYGRIRNRRNAYAHRVAYELAFGPVPDGLQVDHLCRVRSCVNPLHLEAVTKQENDRRGTSPSALNAVKTHCPQGHPYDEMNTYIHPNGHPNGRRDCRPCNRAAAARYRARKRES